MINLVKKIIPVTFILLAAVIACNAPRTNPLDPDNEHNVYVKIEGTVQTVTVPRRPVADVQIEWEGGGNITYTSGNGAFLIEDVVKSDGWLRFEHPLYYPVSKFISWGMDKTIKIDTFLNAMPRLENLNVYSEVKYNSPGSDPVYSLVVEVSITDDENDIDSVFVKNEEINFSEPLEYNLGSKQFERVFIASAYGWDNLELVVDKHLEIIILETTDSLFYAGSEKLERVITSKFDLEKSPAENQIVQPPFNLEWKEINAGFTFSYKYEIFERYSDNLIASAENIPSGTNRNNHFKKFRGR